MKNDRDTSIDHSQGGNISQIKSLFKDDPLKPLTSLGGGLGLIGTPSKNAADNKEYYFQKKKREDIDRMEAEIA